MAVAPEDPPKTRQLDEAAGGGEVPLGPLGGPVFKTNEQLNAERVAKEAAERDAELAAAGVSVTVDNTGDPAPPVNIGADPVTPPTAVNQPGNPLS